VRRIAIWCAAISVAALVGIGIDSVMDARGRAGLVLVVATLVLQAGVAALIVTALDVLFPAHRGLRHS
jgi:hypothetical protein